MEVFSTTSRIKHAWHQDLVLTNSLQPVTNTFYGGPEKGFESKCSTPAEPAVKEETVDQALGHSSGMTARVVVSSTG